MPQARQKKARLEKPRINPHQRRRVEETNLNVRHRFQHHQFVRFAFCRPPLEIASFFCGAELFLQIHQFGFSIVANDMKFLINIKDN